jgi:hypothetical protein
MQEEPPAEDPVEDAATSDNHQHPQVLDGHRACAMCVKDFALPGSDDEDEEEDLLNSGKKLTLRQRKTLERQREQKKKKKRRNRQEGDGEDEEESQGSNVDEMDTDDDQDEDENDPFLKAVGGADKLLTGEAYQQSLLQKEQASS